LSLNLGQMVASYVSLFCEKIEPLKYFKRIHFFDLCLPDAFIKKRAVTDFYCY
jgi:hypothetical protein